jgi:hypothetical protein
VQPSTPLGPDQVNVIIIIIIIPIQKFWLWKPSGVIDMGSEELDGRSREETWRLITITCTGSGAWGIAGYTEAQACA